MPSKACFGTNRLRNWSQGCVIYRYGSCLTDTRETSFTIVPGIDCFCTPKVVRRFRTKMITPGTDDLYDLYDLYDLCDLFLWHDLDLSGQIDP